MVALRTGGIAGERLIDALIGGGCALLISLLLVPPHPLPVIGSAMRAALRGVAAALGGAADALATGRARDPDWTLATTHRLHGRLAALAAARVTAADIVRLAPLRRRWRPHVERANRRAAHVALLANTALTLVRLAAAVLDEHERPPRWLSEAVAELADAVGTLARGASPAERARVREVLRSMADQREPVYGPPEVAATELELRAAAGDALRVIRDDDEDAAWRRSARMRAAAQTERTAKRARRLAEKTREGTLRRP